MGWPKKTQRGAGGSLGSWGFLIFETRTRLVITGTMTAERFKFHRLPFRPAAFSAPAKSP